MHNGVTQASEMEQPGERPAFWRRHWQKLLVLAFWLIAIGGYQWFAWSRGLGPLEAMQRAVAFLSTSTLGPLLYIVLYTLRPLILFPATVVTIAAGVLFGPVLGIAYTIIGSNLSAMVAYMIGRWFGAGLARSEHAGSIVQRYADRLRTNSFATVLTMRFIFLPYDLVNYLCGFLRIDWKAYLLATILGSLPGTISIVLAGASLHGDFSAGLPDFDPRVFAVSAVVFVTSLLLSRLTKRREQASPDHSADSMPDAAPGKGTS